MLGRLKELPEFMLVRALRSVVEDVELSMTAVGAVPCLRLPAGASFFCGSPLQSDNGNGISSTFVEVTQGSEVGGQPEVDVIKKVGTQVHRLATVRRQGS